MEGMMIITSIVVMVFGILQIVLFFKIWGMCNNVKKLSKEFIPSLQSRELSVKRELAIGGENVKGLLFDYASARFKKAYVLVKEDYYTNKDAWKNAQQAVRDMYNQAAIDTPESFDAIDSLKSYVAVFGSPDK